MEVRQVIHHPCLLDSFLRQCSLLSWRCKGCGTEDYHVQATRWRIVYPFCGELADGEGAREVDLLSINELVVGTFTEIFDVFDYEWVGGGLADEKDNLCASMG